MSLTLVTGASGFIGRALCEALESSGRAVRRAVRRLPEGEDPESYSVVGEVGPETDWSEALEGVEAVVHLAARVHILRETAPDPLAAFRRVNAAGTERLARSAAASGARRLVFLSSLSVHGNRTLDRPLTESAPLDPQNDYARSKREAEEMLHRAEAETGLEAVIVRAPLVYGPGAPGNFDRLTRLAQKGIPLPLASVKNRRSWIYIDNLVDLLVRCIDDPRAAGETFLACDGDDISTPDLIRRIAEGHGLPARLIPCPPSLLRMAASLAGKGDEIRRLTESLAADGSHVRRTLGWKPPRSAREGLEATIRHEATIRQEAAVRREAERMAKG